MATVRKAAPARMKEIMQVVIVAPRSAPHVLSQLSEPPKADRISAPSTPTTAASVGEARPA